MEMRRGARVHVIRPGGTQGSPPYITPLTRDGLLAPIARIPNPSV